MVTCTKSRSEMQSGCGNPFYGRKHSEESKRKNAEWHTGKTPWNKGLTKDTDERVKEQGLKHQGWNPSSQTRKKMSYGRSKVKPRFINTNIELKLQRVLKDNNIKFETQKSIYGHPDIFIEPNICIFADGDYWHNLENFKKHDTEVNMYLKDNGYKVIRFWQHEINKSVDKCFNKIKQEMN